MAGVSAEEEIDFVIALRNIGRYSVSDDDVSEDGAVWEFCLGV